SHAARNPYSLFTDPLSLEQVMSSPAIFGPLTRLMCCPPTCGGAAVVVVSENYAKKNGLDNLIEIAGMALTTDTDASFSSGSMINAIGADASRRASATAYEQAGVGPEDVDLVELHDCFSTNEVVSYEALGLCPEGGAEKFVLDGDNTYGGRVVTNPSGGLLSKGHPLGATGLAQITELSWHLRGSAGERQVEGAKIGLQHNIGLGGACVVSVLKRA
ncbi:MAG: thiolase C-terminal domain-containing protein, partial [Spongiibacter sp.]